MSDELKACPFCGNAGMWSRQKSSFGVACKVQCSDECCAVERGCWYGDDDRGRARATEVWNTRTDPSAEIIAVLVEALEWFTANLRVKEEDGTGSQYGRASLWEGPEQAQLCICMATSSYSLASVGAIDGALIQARQALTRANALRWS